MTKQEAIDKIKELTGLEDITNGHLRMVYNQTIGLFESEIRKETDFYFIPVVGMRKPDLYHNRWEVWKLDKETIMNFSTDPEVSVLQEEKYDKYIFPLRKAKRLYPVEEDALVTPEFVDFEEVSNVLTEKDKVCIRLKVPHADTEWVNDLIKESEKRKIKLLKFLLEE